LPQGFERLRRKLRKLIKEQHAMVASDASPGLARKPPPTRAAAIVAE
jgi:hypothetical protein